MVNQKEILRQVRLYERINTYIWVQYFGSAFFWVSLALWSKDSFAISEDPQVISGMICGGAGIIVSWIMAILFAVSEFPSGFKKKKWIVMMSFLLIPVFIRILWRIHFAVEKRKLGIDARAPNTEVIKHYFFNQSKEVDEGHIEL